MGWVEETLQEKKERNERAMVLLRLASDLTTDGFTDDYINAAINLLERVLEEYDE